MKDEEIDDILKSASQVPPDLDPVLLERIGDSIKSSLHPVRPLPPVWLMAMGLVVVCAAVSLMGATRAGFFGIAKMDLLERSFIFPALVLLACFAAVGFVHQMIPASRLRVTPGTLLAFSSLALLAVFADLFRDYRTEHFFSAGIVCLLTGLLHAIPSGLLSWLILRRGFAVNPVSAGLVAGTLSGLAGVGVLELHCPNFQAAHILVWHTAVVPLSAALGALLGWVLRFQPRSREL
ncbi:MAG TPA: NrsF family protein [Candidatus Sulfotelmatobacter sp.]|nr:NrsF family protein [Candidatus Sulfotelmatobacter sp.]